MQNKLRILCLFIVLVMLVSCFAACVEPTDDPKDTEGKPDETQAATDGNGTTPESETDYVTDELPEIDYGGEPFYLLTWPDAPFNEFESEELDSTDIVENAIYERRLTVNARLNIDLQYVYCLDDENDVFLKLVQEDTESDQAFHAIAAYSKTAGVLAYNGYLANLKSDAFPYIDLEKPWWPATLIEESTIKDTLYFVSGDISHNALNQMYLCLVNTDLLEQYKLENPQKYIKSGEWTYEKFIQYCTGVYEDRDGIPGKSASQDGGIGDIYGYMTFSQHLDPFLYNAGASIVTKDDNGNLIANPAFAGEDVQNTLTMLNNLFHNTNDAFLVPKKSTTQRSNFRDGNVLFLTDRARVTHEDLSFNQDLNYSVLPCPKLDVESDYVTVMGNAFTIFGLPTYAKTKGIAEIGSAYLEAFASESYRSITPALFEKSFKLKYSDSSLTAEVYDLIRSKISYDLGKLFSAVLIGQKHFRDAVDTNAAAGWTSTTKVAMDQLSTLLPELQEALVEANK